MVVPLSQLLTNTAAGATSASCSASPVFFGLVPWYYYLPRTVDTTGSCAIGVDGDPSSAISFTVLGSQSSFLLIGLAILDDLLRVAALVAIGFVIYGGIQYVTSQGSPDSTKQAQQTIINALIGLIVALMSVAIVSFIGHKLGTP